MVVATAVDMATVMTEAVMGLATHILLDTVAIPKVTPAAIRVDMAPMAHRPAMVLRTMLREILLMAPLPMHNPVTDNRHLDKQTQPIRLLLKSDRLRSFSDCTSL
jgi:hypothetical protein